LSNLVKIVGADRLLLGSDWPIGEADPVGFIERCSEIGNSDKKLVKGWRAAELIGLVA
jgi:aminocarboxymuconate-semialdehyde decarboxylase